MRVLPKEFENVGMKYVEIKRFDDSQGRHWRIYQRGHQSGALTLARIDIGDPVVLFGNNVPERELFPSSEMWGRKAWDFHNEADLHAKVLKLMKGEEDGED